MTAADYDYVIAGGGPAGCVLAWRLSEDPAVRVLLLEAGAPDRSAAGRLRARFTSWPGPGRVWPYETVPQAGLKGRRVYLPQGRTLGGGSAVNAMTYIRGRADDYAAWDADGWSPAAVLDAFKRIEHNCAIADDWHGRQGPLAVSDQVHPHRLSRAFVAASADLGLPVNRDFNGASQEGLGLYQVTQRNGRRCSAADAFLGPARARPNLTLLTGACATKVRLAHGRATGVEFERGGRRGAVAANVEVIVSGGAINSPKLLLLSGIGPGTDLHALGIPVAVDLPGVGRNLHDHLNVQVIARSRTRSTYDHWARPARFLRFGLQYALLRRGLGASTLCEAGGFLRRPAAGAAPDLQLHFLPLIWRDYGRERVPDYGVTLEAAFLQPRSRGAVTLASADHRTPPRIDPRYCTEGGDVDALVDALERCREILAAPSMARHLSGELFPGAARRARADLADYVRASGVTAYHPVGTCRMGRDTLAVVDERLRVRGVDRLRVVDSSIMPRIVSGSTQAPSMMIGEMGASFVLGDRGR